MRKRMEVMRSGALDPIFRRFVWLLQQEVVSHLNFLNYKFNKSNKSEENYEEPSSGIHYW